MKTPTASVSQHLMATRFAFFLLISLGACASNKAIEEGTCGDDELIQLQEQCLQFGCSYESSKSATGLDSCAAEGDLIQQSGSATCALEGSGSCSIACTCEDDGSAACASWGDIDCRAGRPPRAAELDCVGMLKAVYENAYCFCEEEIGMDYCVPY